MHSLAFANILEMPINAIRVWWFGLNHPLPKQANAQTQLIYQLTQHVMAHSLSIRTEGPQGRLRRIIYTNYPNTGKLTLIEETHPQGLPTYQLIQERHEAERQVFNSADSGALFTQYAQLAMSQFEALPPSFGAV